MRSRFSRVSTCSTIRKYKISLTFTGQASQSLKISSVLKAGRACTLVCLMVSKSQLSRWTTLKSLRSSPSIKLPLSITSAKPFRWPKGSNPLLRVQTKAKTPRCSQSLSLWKAIMLTVFLGAHLKCCGFNTRKLLDRSAPTSLTLEKHPSNL